MADKILEKYPEILEEKEQQEFMVDEEEKAHVAGIHGEHTNEQKPEEKPTTNPMDAKLQKAFQTQIIDGVAKQVLEDVVPPVAPSSSCSSTFSWMMPRLGDLQFVW